MESQSPLFIYNPQIAHVISINRWLSIYPYISIYPYLSTYSHKKVDHHRVDDTQQSLQGEKFIVSNFCVKRQSCQVLILGGLTIAVEGINSEL